MLIFIGQNTEYECTTLTRNTNALSLLTWSFTFFGLYHTQYSSYAYLVCIYSFYIKNRFYQIHFLLLVTSIVNCLTCKTEVAGEILVCHTLQMYGRKDTFQVNVSHSIERIKILSDGSYTCNYCPNLDRIIAGNVPSMDR